MNFSVSPATPSAFFRGKSAVVATLGALLLSASVAQAGPTLTTLFFFSGASTVSGVVEDGNSIFYGTSVSDQGGFGGGNVYRVDYSNPTVVNISTPHEFPGTSSLGTITGANPRGKLLIGNDGYLYGTTAFGFLNGTRGGNGGGTVFKLLPDGSGFQILHTFETPNITTGSDNQVQNSRNSDGARPQAAVVQGTDDFLYGTTTFGGPNGTGAIFKVSPDGSQFVVLHTFAALSGGSSTVNADGAEPTAALVQGPDGNFYGTTQVGGTNGTGTIFKVSPDGASFLTLHQFGTVIRANDSSSGTNADGAAPLAGLLLATNSSLYGSTSAGGTNGLGTLFQISSDGITFTVLHSFLSTEGAAPRGDLIQATDGNLYGTTSSGGANSVGSIFVMAPDGSGFSNLYSFTGGRAGAAPDAGVTQGADGSFYGTTSSAGVHGSGTMYRFSLTGNEAAPTRIPGSYINRGGGAVEWVQLAVLLLLAALLRLRGRSTVATANRFR